MSRHGSVLAEEALSSCPKCGGPLVNGETVEKPQSAEVVRTVECDGDTSCGFQAKELLTVERTFEE